MKSCGSLPCFIRSKAPPYARSPMKSNLLNPMSRPDFWTLSKLLTRRSSTISPSPDFLVLDQFHPSLNSSSYGQADQRDPSLSCPNSPGTAGPMPRSGLYPISSFVVSVPRDRIEREDSEVGSSVGLRMYNLCSIMTSKGIARYRKESVLRPPLTKSLEPMTEGMAAPSEMCMWFGPGS